MRLPDRCPPHVLRLFREVTDHFLLDAEHFDRSGPRDSLVIISGDL